MVPPSGERPEPAEHALDSRQVGGRVAFDSYIRELAPPAGTSEPPLESTLSPGSAARRLIEALVNPAEPRTP